MEILLILINVLYYNAFCSHLSKVTFVFLEVTFLIYNISMLKDEIKKNIDENSIDLLSNLNLNDVFINTLLKEEGSEKTEQFDFQELCKDVLPNVRFLSIIGNGGMGKTVYLKLIARYLYDKGKFPLYISLSDYSSWKCNYKNKSLLEYINQKYQTDIASENLIMSMQAENLPSQYYLLLDGLDEYKDDCLDLINNELKQIRTNITVILTSRPTHLCYIRHFKKVILQPIDKENIELYITKVLGDSFGVSLIKYISNNQNIYSLAQIPLFLALICKFYRSHPDSINNIKTKSNFLDKVFDILCDEKNIINEKRPLLYDEVLEYAYKLKVNEFYLPSDDLKKIQLLKLSSDNNFIFLHKLFEDYYAAQYIAKNETWKYFLDDKNDVYKIFESKWRQTIIFWFGIDSVKNEDKNKFLKEIYDFKDNVGGYYSRQAFVLAIEIIGEYENCSVDLATKLLTKFANITTKYHMLNDKTWENVDSSNPYSNELGQAIFNTNTQILSKIYFDILQKEWTKNHFFSNLTNVLMRLAETAKNNIEYRNFVLEIFNTNGFNISSDLYGQVFKSIAYNDFELINIFMQRIKKPLDYSLDIEDNWHNVLDNLILLNYIVPYNSDMITCFIEIINNKQVLDEYGDNRQLFINELDKFIRKKLPIEAYNKIATNFPKANNNLIQQFLDTEDITVLDNWLINISQNAFDRNGHLQNFLNQFGIKHQLEILHYIIDNDNLQTLHICSLSILTAEKYESKEYLLSLFADVRTNPSEHRLSHCYNFLAYLSTIYLKDSSDIKSSIEILKDTLKDDINNTDCINWLGIIMQRHKSFENEILAFFQEYINNTNIENDTFLYMLFFIALKDSSKIEYKERLKQRILDDNLIKYKNDNIRSLVLECQNCPNNEDLIEFIFKIVNSYPFKNPIKGYVISLYRKAIFKLRLAFDTNIFKIKHKKIEDFLLKNISKKLANKHDEINKKYYSFNLIWIPNCLIRILKPKYYSKTLKLSKKERLIGKIIMGYLAYQMSYNDFYEICHPIKSKLKIIIRRIKCSLKKFIYGLNIFKIFKDECCKKIVIIMLSLLIIFLLFHPSVKQMPHLIKQMIVCTFNIDKIMNFDENPTHRKH